MNNLFDIIESAQGGQGIQNLASQFGLSEDQTRASVEALLPAFSEGLQHNANNSQDLSGFLSALTNGGHQKYYDEPATLSDAATVADGNGILGHLFRSKDLSREVAGQASLMSGVGGMVLKKMLPVIASMVMGGLSKRASGGDLSDLIGSVLGSALGGGKSSGGGGLLGQIAGSVLGGLFGGGKSRRKSQPQTGGDIFGDLLKAGLGGGSNNDSQAGNNPMADIFSDFIKNGRY